MDNGNILTADAAREYLGGISEDTLAAMVRRGLPVAWTGGGQGRGHRLFHRGLVDQWVADQSTTVVPPDDPRPVPAAPRNPGRTPKARTSGKPFVS